MKTFRITKSTVLELWGTSTRLANALGVHTSTIGAWREELNSRQTAQIVGVSILEKGINKTEAFFGPLPR